MCSDDDSIDQNGSESGGVDRLIERMEYCIALVALITQQLLYIEQRLRAAQDRVPGAVLLYMNSCGRNCAGCPHPTWKQWFAKPSKKNIRGSSPRDGRLMVWSAKTIRYPLRSIRNSPTYTPEIEELIQEALRLIRKREDLLKRFKAVWLCAQNQEHAFTRDQDDD
ncbi:hypothetical protein [Halorhodospira sp. 9622]|uniref:hypothetical protein n=1 Tax=Halorhodospira sp. 9622 TaxID=2899136 RepID=UPI001EE7EA94|nr:hypothetical protein [Halorhodospira sp. 9622]MCG5539277.1 hypothetical protein [Halorhodospira sp. 9622]